MIPEIQMDERGFKTLFVDGKPFPVLGGELHNSSASSLDYLAEHVWPNLRGLNLNTIALPVSWELLEPEEDQFDFSLLHGILQQAQREQIRLVLLWFGLWKNGESHYVPEWVKKDTQRFFRVRDSKGNPAAAISPFCKEAIEADKKAFCAMLRFLREKDSGQAVIMIQVENEVGILGADRDYSEQADLEYGKEVPAEVSAIYEKKGIWKQVFGADAEEIFMAWSYAKAIEEIASAGKKEYPLPMYVNAWLEQHPDRAGVYPSGGPVAKLVPFWQKIAVSLDMISPDIYDPMFGQVCRQYSAHGNPLFIPEAARNAKSASRVLYAFGAHHAIGFCPFGIEMVKQEAGSSMSDEQLSVLNIMKDAMNATDTAHYLPASYRIIRGMYQLINENTLGFIQDHPYDRGEILELRNFAIQLDYLPGKTGSGGLILPEEDGLYIVGCNVHFSILPSKGSNDVIELLRYEEGEFTDGKWKRTRVLNGDERWEMQFGEMPRVCHISFQKM